MSLFLVLLPIQIAVFLVTGWVLRISLQRSVHDIVEKNSVRMDGSFSRRRYEIEQQSVRHCSRQLYEGLSWVFVVSLLAGLVVVGACSLGFFDWRSESSPDSAFQAVIYSFIEFMNQWQWQLLTTYIVLMFVVFPPFIFYIYRNSQSRYLRHANRRFMEYYRLDGNEQMSHAGEMTAEAT